MSVIISNTQHCFGKPGQFNVITGGREKRKKGERAKYIKPLLFEG